MSSTRLVDDLFQAWMGGDAAARDRVIALVYGRLRGIARRRVVKFPAERVDADAVAHDTYLRLCHHDRARWSDAPSFYAAFARTVDRVLIDRHRARSAQKRGLDRLRIPLPDGDCLATSVLTAEGPLNQTGSALARLQSNDPVGARVVALRFVVGLTIEETATAIGRSPATTKRALARARRFLLEELTPC